MGKTLALNYLNIDKESHKKISRIALQHKTAKAVFVEEYVNKKLSDLSQINFEKIKENEKKYVVKTVDSKRIYAKIDVDLLDALKFKCLEYDLYLATVFRYLMEELIKTYGED